MQTKQSFGGLLKTHTPTEYRVILIFFYHHVTSPGFNHRYPTLLGLLSPYIIIISYAMEVCIAELGQPLSLLSSDN